jgi:hypothetical protein
MVRNTVYFGLSTSCAPDINIKGFARTHYQQTMPQTGNSKPHNVNLHRRITVIAHYQ